MVTKKKVVKVEVKREEGPNPAIALIERYKARYWETTDEAEKKNLLWWIEQLKLQL